jgi:hypothetical protein
MFGSLVNSGCTLNKETKIDYDTLLENIFNQLTENYDFKEALAHSGLNQRSVSINREASIQKFNNTNFDSLLNTLIKSWLDHMYSNVLRRQVVFKNKDQKSQIIDAQITYIQTWFHDIQRGRDNKLFRLLKQKEGSSKANPEGWPDGIIAFKANFNHYIDNHTDIRQFIYPTLPTRVNSTELILTTEDDNHNPSITFTINKQGIDVKVDGADADIHIDFGASNTEKQLSCNVNNNTLVDVKKKVSDVLLKNDKSNPTQ